MKKYLVALILVLAMAYPAFAQVNVGTGNQTGGALSIQNKDIDIGNLNNNQNTNTNSNTNVNNLTNTQSQGQNQAQSQSQSQRMRQNQNQTAISESEAKAKSQANNLGNTQTIESPQNLLGSPNVFLPPLYFGNGRMEDVTELLPPFAIYGIKPLAKGEMISAVIVSDANIKFKNLYQTVLDDGKKASGKGKADNLRIQIIRAQGQKTWTMGLNAAGAGSGLSPTGLGGGAGAGGIGPQWGGTKADDLFTVLIVQVAGQWKASQASPTALDYKYQSEGWKKVEPEKKASTPARKTVFGQPVSD